MVITSEILADASQLKCIQTLPLQSPEEFCNIRIEEFENIRMRLS
jgi:hypothetical protein